MSSKKDPFNFDDIYAATGNDNFIRKPMGELKKQQPSKTSVANEGRGRSVQNIVAAVCLATAVKNSFNFLLGPQGVAHPGCGIAFMIFVLGFCNLIFDDAGPSVASTPPKHNSAPATVVVKASDFEDLLGALPKFVAIDLTRLLSCMHEMHGAYTCAGMACVTSCLRRSECVQQCILFTDVSCKFPCVCAGASKAKAPAPSASGRSTTQQAKKNAIGMEDLFGDVATAPAVPSKPAPTKAPAPASGTDPFDVFGDVHGAEPAVAAAPAKEFVSSASDDHWEAFTGGCMQLTGRVHCVSLEYTAALGFHMCSETYNLQLPKRFCLNRVCTVLCQTRRWAPF